MRLRNLRFYELSYKLPGSRVVYICFLGFLVQEHNSNAGRKRHGATSSQVFNSLALKPANYDLHECVWNNNLQWVRRGHLYLE